MTLLHKVLRKSKVANTQDEDVQGKSFGRAHLGTLGEGLAEKYLKGEGFCILEKNVRYACGEIDLVARRGGELHFIEVKTRSGSDRDAPFEAVTKMKQKRIKMAADIYLSNMTMKFKGGGEPPCYFDVIGISNGQTVEFLPDVFS